MMWTMLKFFDVQRKAIMEKKKQYNPEVHKLGKNGSIVKWIDSFRLHLVSVIGVQDVLLVYVVCQVQDILEVAH